MTSRCAARNFTRNACTLGTQVRLRHAARGFTLLEVLVSIVVLSFGVLGVVGLQAASMQANKEAKYQAAGARLARELADLMRGNKATAITTSPATNHYLIGDLLPTAAAPTFTQNCVTAKCSPAQLADFQMADWVTRVREELPGARVEVCFDDHPYSSTTGLASWACAPATSGIVVVKMGWSRQSTNRSATAASAIEQAADINSVPLIVLPLTSGI